MNYDRISKNLKFKLDNISISATLETPHAGTATADPTFLKNLHYHVMYELFCVEDEPITVYTEDSVNEYKNCFVCIPPFCKHRTLKQSGLRILFLFDRAEKKSSLFSRFADSFFSKTSPFEIPYDDTMVHIYHELVNTITYLDSMSCDIAGSLLKIIFYKIYAQSPITEKTTFPSNESYLVKIDDIINDFRKDITIQLLADALHLSTKQTSRILQKNYKKKLSEILKEKRLSVAAELLRRSNKTILEIVEYVNFSSERYFYSQFKKAFGCTPHKYRKSNYDNHSKTI